MRNIYKNAGKNKKIVQECKQNDKYYELIILGKNISSFHYLHAQAYDNAKHIYFHLLETEKVFHYYDWILLEKQSQKKDPHQSYREKLSQRVLEGQLPLADRAEDPKVKECAYSLPESVVLHSANTSLGYIGHDQCWMNWFSESWQDAYGSDVYLGLN